jgi:putrescine aminotransferase
MEREDICGRVRERGPLFESALQGLADLPIVGEVRGSHFMMGIEFVKDKATKAAFGNDVDVGPRVARHAQARGLIVRPLGSMAVLSPPLILTEAQIATIAETLRDSIAATVADLAREKLL